jgi:hypothetical protein
MKAVLKVKEVQKKMKQEVNEIKTFIEQLFRSNPER